ncbi:MAG: LPS export ABC transporter periplasmic protein LptC [Sulfitobacter sp.]
MSALRADRHTRTVAWLKVALPLAALGLLSTMFLLSRVVDPESVIPFADKEIQDRLRDQQITGPFFSGTTSGGDALSFQASKLITPNGDTTGNRAEDVLAEVKLASGSTVTLQSNTASFDIAGDQARLQGAVRFNSSTGYALTSNQLISQMSNLHITSPGPVEGTGPIGTITAGAMELSLPEGSDSAHLIFTNGVKLIYSPKQEPK